MTSLPGRSPQSPLPTSSVTPEAAENTSNKVSHDYALQSHDSHTTKSVSVSKVGVNKHNHFLFQWEVVFIQNPSWNEEFQYLLTSKNRYLNVCVWCKLQGEHKNFMIGCVSTCTCMVHVYSCLFNYISVIIIFKNKVSTINSDIYCLLKRVRVMIIIHHCHAVL